MSLCAGAPPSRGAARRRAIAPRAAAPLDWFLRKLAAEGYLERSVAGAEKRRATARGIRCRRATRTAQRPGRARSTRRSLPPFAVVRAMVEHVPEFLRGEKTGEEILFSPASCRSGSTTSPTTTCSTRSTTAWAPKPSPARLPPHAADDRRDRRRLGLGRPRARSSGSRATRGCPASAATSSRRSCRPSCGAPSGRSRRGSRTSPSSSRRLDMDRDFAEQGIAAGQRGPRLRRQHGPRREGPRRDARPHPRDAETRRRRGLLRVRAAVSGAADLRRVRLQLPGELHRRRDGPATRGPTTGS